MLFQPPFSSRFIPANYFFSLSLFFLSSAAGSLWSFVPLITATKKVMFKVSATSDRPSDVSPKILLLNESTIFGSNRIHFSCCSADDFLPGAASRGRCSGSSRSVRESCKGPSCRFSFLWRNHIIFLSKHWPRVSHRKLFSSPIPPLSGKTHLNIQLLGSSVSQTLSLAKLARSKAIGHINDSIKRWHQLQRFAQFALDATRK